MECCSVRRCQCALRAQGWGLNMIWDVYWIYSANNCGVFSVRRCQCAVRAQGWGLNMIWDMYLYDLTIYYKDGDTAKNSINMVKFTPLHRALLQRDHRQGAGLTRELHCPSWAGARLSWRGGWSLPSRQLRCAAQGLRPASNFKLLFLNDYTQSSDTRLKPTFTNLKTFHHCQLLFFGFSLSPFVNY